MGVTNLWALLEPCGRRIDVKALRGKRVAIDASGWIFKFIKAMRDDQGELLPNAHLIGFFRRICKLLFHNIRPIFIFDGSTPVLKRQTVAERRRRRDQQEARVKKTAEKLLLNRLKQHALSQATAQGQQIQRAPATANPQNATNTVTATAIDQQNKPTNEAGPSTSRPNVQPTSTNNTEAATAAVATNPGTSTGCVITDADFELEESETDPELFDFEPMLPEEETIDPVVLATLPPSVQLEVMLRLRDRQQAANRGGFEERTGNPKEFSQFQLDQYLKTSTLRRQLDTLRGAGAAANGAPRPVAAEEAVEYVLERDEPDKIDPQQGADSSQQPGVTGGKTDAATTGTAPKGIDLSFEVGMDEVVSDDGSLGWEDIDEDAPIDPGSAGRDGDGSADGEGNEHWRERAARRQKYWSLSHGFQMGRKLAQWGENEGEEPQPRGRSPPENSPAGVGAVKEDEDSQLQEAIRLSLINDAPSLGKITAHEEQPAAVSGPKRLAAPPPPQREKVPPQQQKQRQIEFIEIKDPKIVDSGDELIRHEINHPEFVPPPTTSPAAPAPVQAPSNVHPPTATAAVTPLNNNDVEIEEEVDVDRGKEEKVESVLSIGEEEETEKIISNSGKADPPVQPLPSTVENVQIDAIDVAPQQSLPPPQVLEEVVQEDALITEKDDDVILPSRQAAKPAAQRPPKVARFTEPEVEAKNQQEQQQDSVMEPIEAGIIAATNPAPSEVQPQPSAPPQEPPLPPPQAVEEPSALPSSQQEAAQFEGLLSTSWPQQQQQQQQVQQQLQNPPPPRTSSFDQATLRKEEATLRAEHRAAAGQSDTPTDIMFAECQELLQLFGLPYLIAPSEAEAQAAWLDAAGLVDGVVTDDNDAFLFGARRLFRNIFEEAKYVEEYRTDELESELGLGRERLVNLALLLGSDYTAGVAGVGVVNAVEIVRAFEGTQGLGRFAKWMKDVDEEIVTLAKLSGAAAGASSSGKGPEDKDKNEGSEESEFEVKFKQKHKTVRKSWNLPTGFPSTEVVAAYLEPKVDNSKEKFTFARPDMDLLRHFCAQKFGWEQIRTDELLIPVLKAYDERQTQQTLDDFIAHRSKFAKIRSKRLREAVAGITGQDNEELVLNEELAVPPAKVKKANKAKAAPRQRKNAEKKNADEEKGDEDDIDPDKEVEIDIDDDDEVIFVEETPAPGTVLRRGRGRGRGRGQGKGRGKTTTRRSRQGQQQEKKLH